MCISSSSSHPHGSKVDCDVSLVDAGFLYPTRVGCENGTMEAVIEGLPGFSKAIAGTDGKANADSIAEAEVAVRDLDKNDDVGDDAGEKPDLEVADIDKVSEFAEEDDICEEKLSEPEPEGVLAGFIECSGLFSLPLSTASNRSPLEAENRGDAKGEGEG